MHVEICQRFEQLQRLVGNTPLLAIDFKFRGQNRQIFAKAEQFNLTGSIKDRMALHILWKACQTGELKPGATIAEATSGNTGIALSALGSALGHPVKIFMPNWMSQERKALLRSFGTDIRLVSPEEGGFLGSIRLSEEFAASSPNVFLPCQFSNDANAEAHATSTGPEIWRQLQALDLVPDGFVAGVGTGGTVMGVGHYLREQNPKVKIHPMEPANSPTLRAGGKKIGSHRIQGISDEFIPALVKLDQLDEIISVDDGDGIILAQKLAGLGLGVGISSGANFIAALMVQEQLGPNAVVVTVFPDDNKKYLSTDLMKDEPVKPGFLSTDVELLSFHACGRV